MKAPTGSTVGPVGRSEFFKKTDDSIKTPTKKIWGDKRRSRRRGEVLPKKEKCCSVQQV